MVAVVEVDIVVGLFVNVDAIVVLADELLCALEIVVIDEVIVVPEDDAVVATLVTEVVASLSVLDEEPVEVVV